MKFILSLALLTVSTVSLAAGKFTLTTDSFKTTEMMPNKHVFNGFGCSGENVSPSLSWTNAPAGTKSFAVTVYDPDAPTGSGWWHWTVVNIPATVMKIEEGKIPAGAVEGRTDFGKAGWGGACPPQGDKPHRYIFTVFALKTDKLDVNADSSGALAGFMINGNSLGKASFTVKYGR